LFRSINCNSFGCDLLHQCMSYLVSTADQVKVVFVQKFGDDFGAECERDAAVVLSPSHRLLVRVGPQQVAQQTLIWHVRRTHDTPNLLH